MIRRGSSIACCRRRRGGSTDAPASGRGGTESSRSGGERGAPSAIMVYLSDELRAKRFPRATTMRKFQLQSLQSFARRSTTRLVALVVVAYASVRRTIGRLARRLFHPVGTVLAARWVRSLTLEELQA